MRPGVFTSRATRRSPLLARWPIRNKLLFGLALLLVTVATLSWGGIHGLYAYRGLVRGVSRRVYELPLANELSQRVSDLRVELSDVRGLYHHGLADREAPTANLQMARNEFRLKLDEVAQNLKRYRDQLIDNENRDISISDIHRERETVGQIEGTLERIQRLHREEDWLLDEMTVTRLTVELEHLQHLTARLPSFLHQNIIDFADDARVQYRTLLVLSWLTTVATMCMLALLIQLFYRWVFRPLRVLVKGSRKVAGGMFHYRIQLQTNDEMAELAAAMNDMTERFQTIRDDLDRQVQERTRQVIRNEQLASVGFLAAGVAHEINNPLASIAMCAESLESRVQEVLPPGSADGQVAAQYLRMIQNEAFRCKEITERLLDFSRIGEVRRQDADLSQIVAGVIDTIRHLGKYQERQITFTCAEAVTVHANVQEMKQVVLNLLTNALDSIEAGGKVTVELGRQEDHAELLVADDGCGMTEEVRQHLFEPFFTRRRGGQGTGLGLSITYRIIADHEGSIEARSDGPGRGSLFRIRLPLAESLKEKRHQYQAA